MTLEQSETLSQSEVVVQGIKQMILDGDLAAGQKLPTEKDLAPRLGVSRGSLREGVRALCSMGVLETRHGAGMYVTSLDPSLLLAPMGFVVDLQHESRAADIHAVRRTLEIEAVGRAALRITDAEIEQADSILAEAEEAIGRTDHETVIACDERFHRLIANASGNPVLAALIEAISSRTITDRMRRATSDEHADLRSAGEHRAVLAALASGDPDVARIRMASHLLDVEHSV